MTKEQAMAKDRVITQADLRHWLKLEKEQLDISTRFPVLVVPVLVGFSIIASPEF